VYWIRKLCWQAGVRFILGGCANNVDAHRDHSDQWRRRLKWLKLVDDVDDFRE
jgi:hypothetical protein